MKQKSIVPSLKEKFIDGEFLYHYYFKVMGTARGQRKLPPAAAAHGMVNMYGKPPSIMGCWKAMWRWAILPENHQKAYDIYNEALADMGRYVTFEEFKEIMRDHSMTAVQFRNEGQKIRFWRRNKINE